MRWLLLSIFIFKPMGAMVDNCSINVMKNLFTMCVMLCCVTVAMALDFTATTDEGYELRYSVTDAGAKTVECLGMADENNEGGEADLVIPEKVSCGGVDYKVMSIGSYVFGGCKGFTGSLTIPDGVESIGENAFRDCFGFSGDLVIGDSVDSIGDSAFRLCIGFSGELVIGDSVESIGKGAFAYCSGFTSVTNKALVPQAIDEDVFYDVAIDSIPLYVPEESIEPYKVADGWREFMSIKAIDDTAIEGVMQEVPFVQQGYVLTFAQPAFVSIFTVSGQLVRSGIMEQCVLPAERGVYVVQTVKGSFKVMVND